jgi:hypothetical protein
LRLHRCSGRQVPRVAHDDCVILFTQMTTKFSEYAGGSVRSGAMAKDKKDLVTVSFDGPRFEDHALDIDVLPELIAYKKLLIETAVEIWRKRNPSKRRLPKGFRDSVVLKFYELRVGSTAVPLFRELDIPDTPKLPLEADELDEAASVLERTLLAAGNGEPPPEELPSSVVPLFNDLGKTLQQSESIGIRSPSTSNVVRFDRRVKEQILSWTNPTYEEHAELSGEVRAASIDATSFKMRLEEGRSVGGKYSAEDKDKILEALKGHESLRLRVEGIVEFYAKDGTPKRFVTVDKIVITAPEGDKPTSADDRPIWEQLIEIGSSVSNEEWKRVPTDLASNVDHYLYGKAKDF